MLPMCRKGFSSEYLLRLHLRLVHGLARFGEGRGEQGERRGEQEGEGEGREVEVCVL